MGRKRIIDPGFWLNEDLAKCSPHARLLYIGLWGIVDDNYATLPNRPAWIHVQIFPHEPNVVVADLLKELAEQEHITLFTHDGKEFWHIPTFFLHQRVDKPSKPKYPPFPGILRHSESGSGTTQRDTLAEVKINKDNLDTSETVSESDEIRELEKQVNSVMGAFYNLVNKAVNFSNKTHREAAKWLIQQNGLEDTLHAIDYIASIKGKPYSPVITNPWELKEKYAKLEHYKATH